jgi:FkbM family methyltransferase
MFHSQFGEDKWIVENVPLPERGVFVEVGAADGVTDSNTLYFEEELGWTGLLIEPDPNPLKQTKLRERKARISRTAIGLKARPFFVNTRHPYLSGFNGVGSELNLPVDTLGNVLRENGIGEIDLLSVDTEGTELEVWESFDPNLHRPKVVVIEWMTLGMPTREVEIRLRLKDYKLRHMTDCNMIFLRR